MKYDPDLECEKLIENIRTLCELKSMSHYAVALKAEISNSTMHSLMNGKTKPYIHTLFKLCNALEVTVVDLFGMTFISDTEMEACASVESTREEENACKILSGGLKADETELLIRYRCLTNKKKEMLREYAEMLRQYRIQENDG